MRVSGAKDSAPSAAKRGERRILPPAEPGVVEAGLRPADGVPARSARTIAVDFDGTVTEMDLLDTIARDFGDPVVYQQVENGLHGGTMPLREVITREFEPVRSPLEEVVEWELENVRVRSGFREFVDLARDRGWRVVIVSSGFHELIEPILEREGVDVELHANRVDPSTEGWRVEWRYDDACDSCGESCKRSFVQELAGEGELIYIGDGFSDRCAAEASDRVFATRGLAKYLDRQGVPYERFDDFYDIARSLAS
jgi:2-hydroxy-3-keto-5-methylthiopentenyl-1-phosphate phosphatase